MPGNMKILSLDELVKVVENLQQQGKTVVQSHGVFDIIHPGIIQHLNEAAALGDVLVVTVIKDKDVRRGPGRPVFPERLRAENVAALEIVDYACVVDDDIPFEAVKRLNPDIFAKGQAYKERDRKIHRKIFEEERELYFGKTKLIDTKSFSFSASGIINHLLEIYPKEILLFLHDFAQKNSFDDIARSINNLGDLKVLIIGDSIIDEYYFCIPMGKSAKAQLVVNQYLNHEVYPGGVLAVANHVAGVCQKVTLITMLGKEDSREDFIKENLNPTIKGKYFYRDDGPTVIKKRYVDKYNNQKLFEINYIKAQDINGKIETTIINSLMEEIPRHDLVIVADFGHGLITQEMAQALGKYPHLLAVNTQTNAANVGFNMITKYRRPRFVCLAENEARLAMQNRIDDIGVVAKSLSHILGTDRLIVTLGKKGSLGLDRGNNLQYTPVFSPKVVDTVGAGDAVFSYTALCSAKGLPLDLTAFVGNVVGAIAVQIMGNKEPVKKYAVLEFINTLLKQGNVTMQSGS
jgi:bifunctional ADP-heptose synthase (sugar kinase/adenylyltransferase)